ncbi:MAG TPA: uroporphyrinogen decarboxylase family protein [Oscillospiraceae bacterium]|nr:uroporphyrinogen decarboxylase family protein [Oscillospiraceae bacterium]
MLSKRQNMLETIKGGKPDRFVNQYEYLGIVMGDPITARNPRASLGGENVDFWGVTHRWPAHVPGSFPVHDQEHKLIKDVTKWQDVLKAPSLESSPEDWKGIQAQVAKIDRNEQFVTIFGAPGIFEQTHYFMGMDDTLINFYEEPEAMHELIDFITEWKLGYAKEIVKYVKPECLFHHDDWGSQINSFLAPDMFAEFFVPAYKKLYSFYKENGVELIVHHNDSFSANLVPHMIEMGIDVWQGCMTTNNTPELVKKYGGQISFMGDLDNGLLDREDWSRELIAKEVRRACETNGKHYFIPCLVRGLSGSTFPGVYEAVSEEIDKMSKEMF